MPNSSTNEQEKYTLKLSRKNKRILFLVKEKLRARGLKLGTILNLVIEFLWDANWDTIMQFIEFLTQRKWNSDNTLDLETKMFLAKLKSSLIHYNKIVRSFNISQEDKTKAYMSLLNMIDEFIAKRNGEPRYE